MDSLKGICRSVGFNPDYHDVREYSKFCNRTAHQHDNKSKYKKSNRARLRQENEGEIINNTCPSMIGKGTLPEEIIEAEETLLERVRQLSLFLKTIYLRTFLKGEAVETVARDLGTTTSAINMARTRIKQHMHGANDDN